MIPNITTLPVVPPSGVMVPAAIHNDEPPKTLNPVTIENFLSVTAGQYGNVDHEVLHWYLNEINTHSPNTLALAVKLLTTGNEKARSRVINHLTDEIIEMVSESRTLEEAKSLDYLDPDEKFYQVVGLGRCEHIQSVIFKYWVYEEMRSELPAELCYFSQMVMAANKLHQMVVQYKMLPKHLFIEEWYWRGLVAQSLLMDIMTHEPNELDIPDTEFIHWAGTHEGIGTVMRLAMRHRTTNIRFLGSLLEDGRVSPLFNGRL